MRGPGLVVLALVAAAALGPAPTAAAADGSPPLSVPAAELSRSLRCHEGAADPEPVLLIPGTGSTPEENFSWNYARVFAEQGRPYCTVELPARALADIQVSAEHVVHALRTMHAAGRDVDVIGWSQGGMIGRWALKYWPDTRAMVDDLVGLAPSNHGTLTGNTDCAVPCAPAVRQQRVGANFISVLNSGPETYAGIDYTVAYTLTDQVIVPNVGPAASSPLRTGDGAISNIAVQYLCPGHAADHFAMGSFDAVGYAVALDAIDGAGPADAARIDRSVCLEPFMPGVDPVDFPTDFARFVGGATVATAAAARTFTEPPLAPYARRSGS